tara:strand:+ start:308 stop:535 length:228 start_codon:yes stop_codon:yes gene_type:complete
MSKKPKKTQLFQLSVFLRQDGRIETEYSSVEPKDLADVFQDNMPEEDLSQPFFNYIIYLRRMGEDIQKSTNSYFL